MGDGLNIGFEVIAAGSALEEGSGGGPGYFKALIPGLRDDPRVERLHLYVPTWYEAADRWRHPKVELIRCPVPRQRPLRVAYEQLGLPLKLAGSGVDALISPSNYRPLAYRGCNVVVLHAIQHFLLNDDIGRFRSAYLKVAVPRSIRGADRAVAVTETLRRDAIDLFALDPKRIVTVRMGPQPWVAQLIESGNGHLAAPYRLPGGHPYVLCISRLYALKNHRRLIRAYARLTRRRDVPHRLLIVGGDADVTSEELRQVAVDAGVGDRVSLLGRVAQAEVGSLYAGASAVAYVSLYETFGHPVLEAFGTGKPLLTSSRGATAEVAGGAARLADPEDEQAIAEGLADVLFDAELREQLVKAGHRRAAEFSWEKCAQGTVDAVVAAIEGRKEREEGRWSRSPGRR